MLGLVGVASASYTLKQSILHDDADQPVYANYNDPDALEPFASSVQGARYCTIPEQCQLRTDCDEAVMGPEIGLIEPDGDRRDPYRYTIFKSTKEGVVIQAQRFRTEQDCYVAARVNENYVEVKKCPPHGYEKNMDCPKEPCLTYSSAGNTFTITLPTGAWIRGILAGWGMEIFVSLGTGEPVVGDTLLALVCAEPAADTAKAKSKQSAGSIGAIAASAVVVAAAVGYVYFCALK